MTIIFFLMSKILTNSPLKISRKKINFTIYNPRKVCAFPLRDEPGRSVRPERGPFITLDGNKMT